MRLGKPQDRIFWLLSPPSLGSFLAVLPGGLSTESLSIMTGKGPQPPPAIVVRCTWLASKREQEERISLSLHGEITARVERERASTEEQSMMENPSLWRNTQGHPNSPSLTCHLQHHSRAVVVLDPDEAGEAALIRDLHTSEKQRDIALGQLVIEESRTVGIAPTLVCQLVPATGETVDRALGICQMPDKGQVVKAEVGLRGEGAAQGGVLAKKSHYGLIWDMDIHGTCRRAARAKARGGETLQKHHRLHNIKAN